MMILRYAAIIVLAVLLGLSILRNVHLKSENKKLQSQVEILQQQVKEKQEKLNRIKGVFDLGKR